MVAVLSIAWCLLLYHDFFLSVVSLCYRSASGDADFFAGGTGNEDKLSEGFYLIFFMAPYFEKQQMPEIEINGRNETKPLSDGR